MQKPGGGRVNTIRGYSQTSDDLIFVSPKLAFAPRFLREHFARQVRGMANQGEAEVLAEADGLDSATTQTLRKGLAQAIFIHIRLLDIASGVDASAYAFPIDRPVSTSPLYTNASGRVEEGFLIFDSHRDTPETGCAEKCIVAASDGNEKMTRRLTPAELLQESARKPRGRPRVPAAGSLKPKGNRGKKTRVGKGKKEKTRSGVKVKQYKSRTAGLFITMRANYIPKKQSPVIREVR